MRRFTYLEDMIVDTAQAVRPPERLQVHEAASKYRYLDTGVYEGYWDNSKTPYLIEFMQELNSWEFTGAAFAGPARCGKTDTVFNWITFTAKCDPADMMVINMTREVAREWSQGDLSKMLRLSTSVGALVTKQNVHDIRFINGMKLLIKWPTITELSGKTIPRLWLADYDRMPQNVDGEGNPFDLARKRAQTFKRFGMCAAEGSPGFPVSDPKWIATSPHEAPPTLGILSIYNRGDRRRWYWKCPCCDHKFEADFKHLQWDATLPDMEAAQSAYMLCPSGNGCVITNEDKIKIHDGYPETCRWIKEGQTWHEDGSITGTPRKSNIASFWLKGVAAAFADWSDLVLNWIKANEDYERTGSEESLKTTTNVDQGHPYIQKSMENGRLPETLKSRARNWGGSKAEPVVPPGVRFLVGCADVQARSFVGQVHGIGEGGDIYLIDTFKLRKSNRRDEQGDPLPLDPGGYLEDWDVLIDNLINRSYPLADGSGRRMQVKMSFCDSGGKDGVTANAYNFWRKLRDGTEGHHKRFRLLKGEPSKSAPRAKESYPDATKRDSNSGARGDVPVIFLNSNLMKDQISAMLSRSDPGGGMVHFPHWLEDFIYTQLTTEIRTVKGWENPRQKRNEAWDLLYYCVGCSLLPPIGLERIKWDAPPSWAETWDLNDLVFDTKEGPRFVEKENKMSLAELAEALA